MIRRTFSGSPWSKNTGSQSPISSAAWQRRVNTTFSAPRLEISVSPIGKTKEIPEEKLKGYAQMILSTLQQFLAPFKSPILFAPSHRRDKNFAALKFGLVDHATIHSWSAGQETSFWGGYFAGRILLNIEMFSSSEITRIILHETHHALLDFLLPDVEANDNQGALSHEVTKILLDHRERQFLKCGLGPINNFAARTDDSLSQSEFELTKEEIKKILKNFVSLYALAGGHGSQLEGKSLDGSTVSPMAAEELLVDSWAYFICDPKRLHLRDPKLFWAIHDLEAFIAHHQTLTHENLRMILARHLTP